MFYLPKLAGIVAGMGAMSEILNFPGLEKLSGVLQFGALGLCAYMVYDQRIERKAQRDERIELVTSLRAKEIENKKLLEKFIDATNRLSEALEDKPCLLGDQRVKIKH